MAPTTAQTALSTPTKTPVKAPATPTTESPGTWRHPRIQEITSRQRQSTFTDKNIYHIAWNLVVVAGVFILHFILSLSPIKRFVPRVVSEYEPFLFWIPLLAAPAWNIVANALPLMRARDTLSDIPLTPGQRELLGLPPSGVPPTPGSAFSTPPRYARTPSAQGSAVSRRSFSSSPVLTRSSSNQESPTPAANGSGLASPSPHILLQKAMLGARRSSLGSMGSPSPLRGSVLAGASIFSSSPESPSPSPVSKQSSVGLSNKWRYNKGMRPKGFRDLDPQSAFT
ncbi:nuclear pore complex component-domain-containing protein [Nemania sp. NC0429]|nr:nuclear pore complex component-domain-containing protein [Nemania sp. NC0429]